MKMLLELEAVNLEFQNNSGRTLLSYAAGVKMLLEREEVNPESQDNSNRTPLSYAASADVARQ